jgi:thiol-disulfide isomerase/thioredoxin
VSLHLAAPAAPWQPTASSPPPRHCQNGAWPAHAPGAAQLFSLSSNPYPAVGMFEIGDDYVHGTFMTETGDYRFLHGFFSGDSLVLSAFDGSHAFLFTAKQINDTIRGMFYSGNHYKTDWIAVKNEQATLSNPNSLTYFEDSRPFQFTFPDLNRNFYSFPNHINSTKVTIVMLMGSWCPNCIDEALFFKEVQQKYGADQLKIIALCYEAGDDEKHWYECVQKLRDLHNFPFIFLVAGKANKSLAHQHFPMLNNVISFPTTFYIDKKGDVRKIYTGFYGPATKTYFDSFKKETFELLDTLIAE